MRYITNLAIASAILSLGATASPASSSIIATLPNGDILKGSQCPHNPAVRYRRIPYAQSPVDKLRFMPPQPLNVSLTNSSHPQFDATAAGAPCLQYVQLRFGAFDPTPSENCLTLDVYVPPNVPKNKSLPVKVWSYGGYNQVGSTSFPLYDGCTLATDAIVVTVNYRLGPMGWLSLGDAGIPGNMGLQDHLLGLRWVRDNIAAFGGDREKVLLFGESAGGDNTWVISTLEEAKGLINGAIIESGGGSFLTAYEDAQILGGSFAKLAGCEADDLSCLQKVSLDTIEKAYSAIPEIYNSTSGAQRLQNIYSVNVPRALNMASAVVDGKVIKHEPLLVGPQVPLVGGSTETDAGLLVIPVLEDGDSPLSESNYTDFLNSFEPAVSKQVGQRYPLSAFDTFNDTSAAVVVAITHVATVSSYTCPVYYASLSSSLSNQPSYLYHFNHTPSCPWLVDPQEGEFPTGQLKDYFGPTHTSEIPFVFGGLDRMPFGNGSCNSTREEYAMSGTLIKAWTAVAEGGSPATDALKWPRFEPCKAEGVLIGQGADVAVKGLDFGECEFWAGVWQRYARVEVPYLNNKGNASRCEGKGAGNKTATTGSSTGLSPTPSIPVSPSMQRWRISSGALWGGLLVSLACSFY